VYKEGQATEFAYARTNPIDGGYKLALAGGAKYLILADYNSLQEINRTDTIRIDLTDLKSYEERELNPICFEKKKQNDTSPSYKKIPIRAHIPSFESVYFDHDKFELTPKAVAKLTAMADTLQAYPNIQINVLGHTDSNGSNEYNWTLAINRSAAVINYLEKKGVNRTRFVFKGFGETKPAAKNTTHKGRANNRRVEFQVVQPINTNM
jgi:outer membrane protein OmpA-like peptidoglycan-associated protein